MLTARLKPHYYVSQRKQTQTDCCVVFTVAASYPLDLTNFNPCFSFFSGLLSSDYVEIHYEGGKPVLSKVTSSVVLTQNVKISSFVAGVWFSVSSRQSCTSLVELKAQLFKLKTDVCWRPVNQFAFVFYYLSLCKSVTKLTLQLSHVKQKTADIFRLRKRTKCTRWRLMDR